LVSPLEPLHPDGRVDRIAVVGSSCPPHFLPPHADDCPGQLDAVIFAPDAAEWTDETGLLRRLTDSAARLARDGFAYAIAPPGRRGAVRSTLLRAGLGATDAVVHVPDVRTARYLVPLDRRAGSYAFSELVAAWPQRGRLIHACVRTGAGRALLGRVLEPVGFLARRPDARAPYAWLARGFTPTPHAVLTVRRGRGSEDRLALIVFSADGDQPLRVVKIADSKLELQAEASVLDVLGESASAAGAEVPRVVASAEVDRRFVVAYTPLAGTSAAAVLSARPHAVSSVLDRVAAWLERWHLETHAWAEPVQPVLEQQVVAPLRVLEQHVPVAYRDRLIARCNSLAGARLPVVAAHNDLTMFNVLIGPGGQLGIVDWESACAQALPLTDLAYAVVDGVAGAARYRDRVAAFDEVFGPTGRYRDRARRLTNSVAARLELAEDVSELAFHAAWLSHAANEVEESGSGSPGPFVQILHRLVEMSTSQ
jgi:hypothetical protein